MQQFQTIGIIDDDPSITSIFEFILKQVGYRTVSAQNTKQGLQLLKQNSSTRIVFLDADLPNLNMVDFITDILTINEEIKIILMLDYRSDSIQNDAYELGAYMSIFKPFDVEEILGQIKKIITN